MFAAGRRKLQAGRLCSPRIPARQRLAAAQISGMNSATSSARPHPFFIPFSRRRLLQSLALATAGFWAHGAFAEMLALTARQTEGPFYPDHLPLDTDNDLIVVNNALTPAIGDITYLSGRVLGPNGEPVRGATVEIWQCDANGVYLHTRSGNAGKRDANFQGYGRFLTAGTGEYLFRTIKPVPYTGRCPHIHAKVRLNGRELLTTQLYVKGDPQNENDGIYRSLRDPKAIASVTADFTPMSGAKGGAFAAKWDIVLGTTPPDSDPHDRVEVKSSPEGPGGPGGRGGPGGPRRPPPPNGGPGGPLPR
jgi:protocatechuate 3,4-dioxygenase beta subunit